MSDNKRYTFSIDNYSDAELQKAGADLFTRRLFKIAAAVIVGVAITFFPGLVAMVGINLSPALTFAIDVGLILYAGEKAWASRRSTKTDPAKDRAVRDRAYVNRHGGWFTRHFGLD